MASVGAVTVELKLNSTNLTSGIKGAKSQLDSLGSKITSVEGKISGKLTSSISGLGKTLKTVGTGALVTGLLGIGGAALETFNVFSKSTDYFKDFEQAVANTASVTGKVGEEYEQAKTNIAEVAQVLGADTVYSSQEAADAMYDLASAGYDVSKMTADELLPMLNLAAATQHDLSDTTALMASTISTYGFEFDDATRVADVFARAIGDSQATMEKLQYSMTYVGPVANMVGMSLEETTAALEVLYNSGQKGQKAGTGLRGVLASLAKPSDVAAGALAELGLTVDDVNPETHKFSDIIHTLGERGLNTTQAFKIFGRTAAPAIGALIDKADDLDRFEEQLNNAGGAAETMAEQQLDTLGGSIEQLSGDIENMWINIGGALAPIIRDVAGGLEDMMPAISEFAVKATEQFVDFIYGLKDSADSILNIGRTIATALGEVFQAVGGTSIGEGLDNLINGMMGRVEELVIQYTPVIKDAVINLINFLKELFTGLQPAVDNFKIIIGTVIDVVKGLFEGLSFASGGSIVDGIVSTVNGIMEGVTGIITQYAPLVESSILKIINTITGIIDGIGPTIENIKTVISNVLSVIRELFDGMAGSIDIDIVGIITDVINKISTVLADLSTTISGQIIEFIPTLKEILSNIITSITEFVNNFGNMKSAAEAKFNEFAAVFSLLAEKLSPAWEAVTSAIEAGFGAISSQVGSASGIWDSLKTTWDQLPEILTNVINKLDPVWEFLNKAFEYAIEVITGFVTNIGPSWDNIKSIFSSAVNIIKSVATDVATAITGLFASFSGEGIGGEELGATIANIINEITGAIADMMKWLEDNHWIIEFGLALAGVAVVAGELIIGIAGIISVLTPLVSGILSVVSFIGAFGLSWTTVSTLLGVLVSTLFPGLYAALGTIGTVLSPVASVAVPLLGSALSAVGTALTAVASVALPLLGSALALILTPVGLAVTAIAVLALAWSKNWGDIRGKTASAIDFLDQQWEKLKEAAALIPPAFEQAKEQLSTVWDTIKTVFTDAINNIITGVESYVSDLKSDYDDLMSDLGTYKDNLVTKWGELKDSLFEAIDEIKERVATWISDKKTQFDEMIADLEEFYNEQVSKWEDIKTSFFDTIDEIKERVATWISDKKDQFNTMIDDLSQYYDDMKAKWEELKSNFFDTIDEIKERVATWISDKKDQFNTMIDDLTNYYNDMKAKWEELKSNFFDTIDEIKERVATWISDKKDQFNTMIDDLSQYYDDMKAKWEELKSNFFARIDEIKERVDNWISDKKDQFNTMMTDLTNYYNDQKAKWEELKSNFFARIDEIKERVDNWISDKKNQFNTMMTDLTNYYNDQKAKWTDIYNSVVETINRIKDKFVSWSNDLYDLYQQMMRELTDLKDRFSSILSDIVGIVEAKAKDIYNGLADVPGQIRNLANDFYNAGKSILESLYDGVVEGFDKAISAAKSKLAELDSYLPASPAKRGPFRKLPDWTDVIPKPIEKGIKEASRLIQPLKFLMSRLRGPIDGISAPAGTTRTPLDSVMKSLRQVDDVITIVDALNEVTFDNFNRSLRGMIDNMVDVVAASREMSGAMDSNSGYSLANSLFNESRSAIRYANMNTNNQTNIKIGTQNNYSNGMSSRVIRNSLASN